MEDAGRAGEERGPELDRHGSSEGAGERGARREVPSSIAKVTHVFAPKSLNVLASANGSSVSQIQRNRTEYRV